MSTPADNRTLKQAKILACALKIIREQGDAGLTMRKIAECADMRLSNLQYYFKSRNDVLIAMVKSYFGTCEAELRTLADSSRLLDRRARARALIATVLHHGTELSDMCRVFRELWAISTRNDVVHTEMMRYYRMLWSVLADAILGEEAAAEQKARIAVLLLPYMEGYSITAPSLPLPTESVIDWLTDLALATADDG